MIPERASLSGRISFSAPLRYLLETINSEIPVPYLVYRLAEEGLGARRGRIVRQLLTESLVRAIAAATLDLGLAWAVLAWLAHQGSLALPLLGMVRVDAAALAWTLISALAAAVLFGLASALRIASAKLQEALRDSGHGASEGRGHDRLRSTLVVTEIALARVLLVGAGLLLRSFLRVLDVDLGFEPSRAAAVTVDYDDGGNPARRSAIWQDVVTRASQIPGVESAGISDNLPMSRNRGWGIAAKGQQPPKDQDFIPVFAYIVSPGYIKAMGMRLISGRDVTWDDLVNNRNVVVINEAVARRPGQNAVGRIAYAGGAQPEVGVVADVRERSAEDQRSRADVPPSQQAVRPRGLVSRGTFQIATRRARPQRDAHLSRHQPRQSASEFTPIQNLVDHATSPRRFFVLLVGTFAGLGLLLASLGVYGVISYSVTRQTQEIGIRMALGATQSRVQLDVLSKTLRLALAGIAVAVIASLAVARLMASLLFQTAPKDPLTFAGMLALIRGVALLAGYLPARRASRINPMAALRAN